MWGSAPPPFYDDEHTPVSPEDFSILVGSCLDQLQEWRFGNSCMCAWVSKEVSRLLRFCMYSHTSRDEAESHMGCVVGWAQGRNLCLLWFPYQCFASSETLFRRRCVLARGCLSHCGIGCAEEYDDWEEYVHNTANVKLFEREIEGLYFPSFNRTNKVRVFLAYVENRRNVTRHNWWMCWGA